MTTIVRNTTKSKSGLFLLELILAIVFFALSSVVCIQLFVKAHVLSNQSSELNMAVIQCQSVAEAFKAAGGDIGALAESGSVTQTEWAESGDGTGSLRQWFAADWTSCGKEAAAYELVIEKSQNGALANGTVSLHNVKTQEAIYMIPVGAYGKEAAQ